MNDEFANFVDEKKQVQNADKVTDIRAALPKQHLLTSPFAIGETVAITPFSVKGTVEQLSWDRRGLDIRVRYFNDYKQVCFEWFKADELVSMK